MASWLAKIFQVWSDFSQNNPYILAYVSLLGEKLVLFCAFAACAWFARRYWKAVPSTSVFDINWHMDSVAEVFLIFVCFQAVAVFFKNPFVGTAHQEGVESVWATVEYLFLLVLVWFVLRFVLKKDLAHAGWRMEEVKADAQVALRGILFIGVLAVLTNFLYWAELLTPSSKIVHHCKVSDLFSQGLFSLSPIGLVLLISPVCEETFYRGFVYPVLRNSLPKGLSIFLLSFFFAAVHFQWNYFILLFLMSWAATVAYDKTQRLFAPLAIHGFYNLLVLLGFFSY